VLGIYLIKNTAKRGLGSKSSNQTPVNTTTVTPPGANSGSIPDKSGTKGDGGSALSSGQQG